jgi:hypothetical protein
MPLDVLRHNQEKCKEALAELYKLKHVNKYFYDSYCIKAVEMLEYLAGVTRVAPK